MSVRGSYIGVAGEFRAMSELFLRGHNPAKSYLEDGADLILENGAKIEVKSSHRGKKLRKSGGKTPQYIFTFQGGRQKRQDLSKIDFVICWCIDDDLFYVIPAKVIKTTAVQIGDISVGAKHKYDSYRGDWSQLDF